MFANSRSSVLNFIFFSGSLEHFFLTVGQNNFGNKIPIFILACMAFRGCLPAFGSQWDVSKLFSVQRFAFLKGFLSLFKSSLFHIHSFSNAPPFRKRLSGYPIAQPSKSLEINSLAYKILRSIKSLI